MFGLQNLLKQVVIAKDKYGEVEEWICNECRFEKKNTADWKIEGPSPIHKSSVISQNHYTNLNELKVQVMKQQKALGFMDINKRP